MLSEYTEDLASKYKNGEEALFFHDQTELFLGIRNCLSNANERIRIASAGQKRCIKDGNSNCGRAKVIMDLIEANNE